MNASESVGPEKSRALAGRRILSGMRTTGRLHLGHYVGALVNWKKLQFDYDCFFMAADWHALTDHYEDSSGIPENTRQVVIDWLSVGIEPERSPIFVQSRIKEHAELALLLGMFTPVPWLLRTPSYKDQVIDNSDKRLETFGFLGYPVLQAADILMYKAHFVPIGDDQVPHLEMCRELVRRFGFLYKPIFPEPKPILSLTPRLLGSDGRKMSKSLDNGIYLSDPARTVEKKIMQMVTDPARVRRTDPGNPDVCSVFDYHKVFNVAATQQIDADCRSAAIGCTDCKKLLAGRVNDLLEPMRAARAGLEAKPKRIDDVLADGEERARAAARRTMEEVREALHLPLDAPKTGKKR